MIKDSIAKLTDGLDLTRLEARSALSEIFSGAVSPGLIAAFLVAFRMKGENSDEIAGCAEAMREAGTRIHLGLPVVVDTCGTGGDKQGSFNISTAAALVVAGAGFTVAKHGNRSISSQCGSADVLEVLGVRVDPPVPVVHRCLREVGIGFLFAPAFHPAMKHAMPVRRELGLRTVFNVLGPLTNPAGANAQVVGVYEVGLVDKIARVLVELGVRESMVVHGAGHDEINLAGVTVAAEIVGGKIRKRRLSAADFGLKKIPAKAVLGGSKEDNAAIIRRILAGEPGPQRSAVTANAAAAILVGARAAGRTDVKDLKAARKIAEDSLDSGRAREKLERLARLSQEPG